MLHHTEQISLLHTSCPHASEQPTLPRLAHAKHLCQKEQLAEGIWPAAYLHRQQETQACAHE
jgi:hypothetical protein